HPGSTRLSTAAWSPTPSPRAREPALAEERQSRADGLTGRRRRCRVPLGPRLGVSAGTRRRERNGAVAQAGCELTAALAWTPFWLTRIPRAGLGTMPPSVS